MGSCTNPHLKSLYISRHNKALQKIWATLHSYTTRNNTIAIMDATGSTNRPPGIISTRLPLWLLPPHLQTDPNITQTFIRMRPDLLIIEGLTQQQLPALNDTDQATFHSTIKPRCTIHILELTYTFEALYSETLNRKQAQHQTLLQLLSDAGWTVSPANVSCPVHTVILGVSGVIFTMLHDFLDKFGIPAPKILKLQQDLHVHAVHYATYILHTRKTLTTTSVSMPYEPP